MFAGKSFAAHRITNWPENKLGAVSLSFDDSLYTHLSLAIPALNARDMKGTFFVITNGVDWNSWRNAANMGHEIGSHTISHPHLTTLSLAQVQVELGESKAAIDNQIPSQKVRSFSYPFGEFNDDVELIAQNYYFAARGTTCELNQEPYDFYNLRACSPDTFDDLYTQADAAAAQGKWLVVYFHNLDGTELSGWFKDDLENYLDYMKAKNLWPGSFGAIVKYVKERGSATLSVSSSTSSQIVINLTDNMEDAVYDEPLTIRSDVPADWTYVTVQQGGSSNTVASEVEGAATVIYYNAIPDRGPISLTRITSSGNQAPHGVIGSPAQNLTINVGEYVTFTGAGTDPEGNLPLSYRWSFGTGSGIPDSTVEDPGAKQFNTAGIYNVTFIVTDALGLSDPAPNGRLITVLGGTSPGSRVWIPAATGTLSGKMVVGTDYAANSLAGTLVYPNTTEWNTDNHTQADGVAYTVGIPAAGTWYLWARMYYPGTTVQPTNDPNSFWASVDGGTARNLGNRTDIDRAWHWEGAAGSLLSLGNLSAGNHTLRVWNREARETAGSKLSPRIDVLFLTSEAGYTPNDADAATALAPAPTVATTAASSITISGATVNGGVNPNGQSTTAWFEWGTSAALATFSSTSNQSLGSGTTSMPVTAALSGLSPGTAYYFRVAASNAAGTTKGSILSFSTTTALAPTATTNAATSVTASGATVNGGVNPNGQSTTAWFEWGTSPTLATFSSTSNQSLGSGTTSVPVNAVLSGLTSGTTYYFRVAASNAAGTTKGSILSSAPRRALAPTVTTNAAASMTIERRDGERRGEPERPIDDRLVRVGDQPDPGDVQLHFQPVPGLRDDERAGHRGAVGVESRDDVLLPGGGLERRGYDEGLDPQFHHLGASACPDGGDDRGFVHHDQRRDGERRCEPERPVDDRLVRVGDQRGPGDVQLHFQPVPGLRVDEHAGHRGAVGVDRRDDVLLPGGGFQLRWNDEGCDRQLRNYRCPRVHMGHCDT